MKTSELTGVALDWAVGYARCMSANNGKPVQARDLMAAAMRNGMASPSTDWAQGGPIIEREKINAVWEGTLWVATRLNPATGDARFIGHHYGSTALIAAMRCFVASRLGAEVDVPEELR